MPSTICQFMPEPGELAWISESLIESEKVKHDLPGWALTHLVLVLHVTPVADVKAKSTWVFPVSLNQCTQLRNFGCC